MDSLYTIIMSEFLKNLANAATGGVTGLVGSLATTLGSVWSNAQNKKLAEQQMSWNEDMMTKQNEFNEQMWNKNNEYNSPEHQLDRLRDAGVNPLFSGLDGTGNSSGALTSASPQAYTRADVQNPLAGVSPLTAAQIANINADTANKEQDSELKEAQTRETNLLMDGKFEYLGAQINLAKSGTKVNDKQIEALGAEIAKREAETKKTEAEIDQSWQKLDIDKQKLFLEKFRTSFDAYIAKENLSVAQKNAAISMFNAQTSRMMTESNIEINDHQKYLIDQQTETEGERTWLVHEQGRHETARVKQTEATTKLTNTQEYYQERFNEVYDATGMKQAKANVKNTKSQTAKNYASAAKDVMDVGDKVLDMAAKFAVRML